MGDHSRLILRFHREISQIQFAVMRVALQISSATFTTASLLWFGSSADMIELAATVNSNASS
jgi:hypothetical protein